MANNSRGLCPRCGGAGAECCGGQVNEEAWAANRKRITELEAALAERDQRIAELEEMVRLGVYGDPELIARRERLLKGGGK